MCGEGALLSVGVGVAQTIAVKCYLSFISFCATKREAKTKASYFVFLCT